MLLKRKLPSRLAEGILTYDHVMGSRDFSLKLTRGAPWQGKLPFHLRIGINRPIKTYPCN